MPFSRSFKKFSEFWKNLDKKFKREIKLLLVLVIITALFDNIMTYWGTNGNCNLLLEREVNPFVKLCVAPFCGKLSIISCLLLSKILATFLFLVCIYCGFLIDRKYEFDSLIFEPWSTSVLIFYSLHSLLGGLTWVGFHSLFTRSLIANIPLMGFLLFIEMVRKNKLRDIIKRIKS